MTNFDGYRITSPYGNRKDPITGATAFHTGIDLVKAHLAPIAAFTAGEVVHAREGVTGSGFGNFGVVVAIKDSVGALHCYAHLDSARATVGQRVVAGEVIGFQGSTGRSTGSHLHYEVRLKAAPSYGFGTHTDPGKYLDDYYAKIKEEAMSKTFSDVPANHWAAGAIEAAQAAGIMGGYPDGTFKPGQPVTRAELAVVVVNLLAKK